MPDGDLVRYGVSRAYSSAYKEMCEGYFPDEHIARRLANGLRQSLKRYGNAPVKLLNETCSGIADLITKGQEISLIEESQLIDDMALELRGHRRGTPLAVDACKDYAMKIHEGRHVPPGNKPLIRAYVSRAFEADFLESLPLLHHHNGTNPQVIEERLAALRPFLEMEIERIVSQIANSGTVDNLRRKSKDKSAEPDYEQMDISMPYELVGDGYEEETD